MCFLGLLPIAIETASGIGRTLTEFLVKQGLNNDIMREQFIGFCSNGAGSMIGEYQDVATLLKANYPLVKSFHCMTHRLEYAVKNSVDLVFSY